MGLRHRILFVHQNFPAQFVHLAKALAAAGHEVVALTLRGWGGLDGVRVIRYGIDAGVCDAPHPLVADTQAHAIRGEACARAALQLREEGFRPDLIHAHPGWGEALFFKDVFPEVPLVGYFEYFYQTEGADLGFDPEFPVGFQTRCRARMKNAVTLLSLESCDYAVTPTHWQRSRFPEAYRDRMTVLFDGIDTQTVRPDPEVNARIPGVGEVLTPQDEVVTFVNRNLEPYRGYHSFMRAVPEILARRPNAHILIIGGDDVSYGPKPVGMSYKDQFLAEVAARIDPRRVHFLGSLAYADYLRVLQLSSVHVYLTYPFILSWSMLEAMAAQCLVIASRTPPVTEVIRDRENGLLVDFFSPEAIAELVDDVFRHPDRMAAIRGKARETVCRSYDLYGICLPDQRALLERIIAGGD